VVSGEGGGKLLLLGGGKGGARRRRGKKVIGIDVSLERGKGTAEKGGG